MSVKSVGEAFKLNLQSAPSRPFLHGPTGESWTRQEFHALADNIAKMLWSQGARQGERVTAVVEKTPQAFAVYLACQYVGYVYHPANIGYTDAELSFLIGDAKPKVVICDPSRKEGFAKFCDATLLTLDAKGEGSLLAFEQNAEPYDDYQANADDWAALLYTSGTTGKPKGAMLSQNNLLSNALTLLDAWKISDQDRLLHILPIFHTHGLFVAGNTSLCSGCEILWENQFNLDRVFERLTNATTFMAVPTHYGRMLADERLNKNATQNMRLFISGSAPLDAVSSDLFFEKTGLRVLERYGMTETNMLVSNPYDGDRIAGSVGVPLPGIALRIRKHDGELAETGEVGIVEVQGPNVCKGYLGLEQKTKEAFTDDNYFITGDLGRLNDEGYLTLQGRESDMIISGGFNVYPREVENALLDQDGIKEAAVFGLPHPDFGEGVTAAVVLEGTSIEADSIIQQAKALLAAYKVPKKVIFMDELPKNAMGKVDRKGMKAEHAGMYKA
ncbi:MAG: AMP-binding protein [Agarilytica sp.]